jgi:hypothetical protein
VATIRIADAVAIEVSEEVSNLWSHGGAGSVVGEDPRGTHRKT